MLNRDGFGSARFIFDSISPSLRHWKYSGILTLVSPATLINAQVVLL